MSGKCLTCGCATKGKFPDECGKCRKRRTGEWRTPEGVRRLRERQYQKFYGISLTEYETMYAIQDGKCAVCGEPETTPGRNRVTPKYLAVDHDHRNGRVRALLCDKCNRAIGLLRDDPALIEAAAKYVRGFAS